MKKKFWCDPLDLSQLYFTSPKLAWPFGHPIDTLQTPCRHLLDTLETPSRHPPAGWQKIFHFVGTLDSLANISPEIAWFTGQLGLYRIKFCNKKSILMKRMIFVTRSQFFLQEINSCHKKLFLVSLHPFVKPINLQQCMNPTKKFAWAYRFRGNLVPRFPANSPPWST